MSTYKKIDSRKLTKAAIKKLTYDDLVSDAVARKDKSAYDFLCEVAIANAGKEPRNRRRIPTIRTEYLARFHGYGAAPQKPEPTSELDRQMRLLDSVACHFSDGASYAS